MDEPTWATDSTRSILSLLDRSDVALSKRGVEVNLELSGDRISYSTIKEHLRLAEASGLVEVAESEGTWYKITEKGRRALLGDLDASELDKD